MTLCVITRLVLMFYLQHALTAGDVDETAESGADKSALRA